MPHFDLNTQLNIFNNSLDTSPKIITFNDFVSNVRAEKFANISKARNEYKIYLHTKNKAPYDAVKSSLQGITFSVICNNRAKETESNTFQDKFISHTGLIQIDIDKLATLQIYDKIWNWITKDKHILIAFRSPSGYGIKAFAYTDLKRYDATQIKEKHNLYFRELEAYYNALLKPYNTEIDTSPKDLFRLCYVSNDKDIYLNEDAIPFCVSESETLINAEKPNIHSQVSAKLHKPNNANTQHNTEITKEKIKEYKWKYCIEKPLLSKAVTGNRHELRLKIGSLLGGFIAGGVFDESSINDFIALSDNIADKHKTNKKELDTILDAVNNGKKSPIYMETLITERDNWIKANKVNIYGTNAKLYENGIPNKVTYSYIDKVQEIADNHDITEREKTKETTLILPKELQHTFEVIDESTGELIEVTLPFCFWYETSKTDNKGNESYSLHISELDIFDLIKNLGLSFHLQNEEAEKILIQKSNNVFSKQDIARVNNFISQTLLSILPNQISPHFTLRDLRERLLKNVKSVSQIEKYTHELEMKKYSFQRDNSNKSFFYFRNGFIEVSKNGINFKPYSELKGNVWQNQITDFDFEKLEQKDFESFAFTNWIKDLCTQKDKDNLTEKLDELRHKSLINVIGYLLHTYKDPANIYAVIFTEATISDHPEGRTGKSLLMKAISKLRRLVIADARNMDFKDRFLFQNIELDTQIFLFNDATKRFPFDNFFSSITEGISYEQKGKQRVIIPFEESPKIAITTNYTMNGDGGSAKARQFNMELLPYYNAEYMPIHKYKKRFFDEWNKSEWNMFYNFMIYCSYQYFMNECQRLEYVSETLEYKKLLLDTNKDFLEFMDNEFNFNEFYSNQQILDEYNQFLGNELPKGTTKQKVKSFVERYADFYNLQLITGKIDNKRGFTLYKKVQS